MIQKKKKKGTYLFVMIEILISGQSRKGKYFRETTKY
jgi:hypothetical protein